MYRIFIVEDDPGLAEGIAQMVQAWGMDARIAGDFRRVAQEFAEYQPHLAVLDISLPFFNGYYWQKCFGLIILVMCYRNLICMVFFHCLVKDIISCFSSRFFQCFFLTLCDHFYINFK